MGLEHHLAAMPSGSVLASRGRDDPQIAAVKFGPAGGSSSVPPLSGGSHHLNGIQEVSGSTPLGSTTPPR